MNHIPQLNRDLAPFEHAVLGLMCQGLTNRAIAQETRHTEKTIENTISRSAQAFDIKAGADCNLRVTLAFAYRMHFGDTAMDQLLTNNQHFQTSTTAPTLQSA